MANTPLVVLIGDSIRMGYQDHVASQLEGRTEVWVPKENGGDSRNVLAHLDQWIFSRQPDPGTRQLWVARFEAGLWCGIRSSLGRIRGQTCARYCKGCNARLDGAVVWATTTPVDENWHHQNKGFDRLEADVEAYNAAARAVAEESRGAD